MHREVQFPRVIALCAGNRHRRRLRISFSTFYLTEFAGASVGPGGSCFLIASQKHRQHIRERLRTRGIDFETRDH